MRDPQPAEEQRGMTTEHAKRRPEEGRAASTVVPTMKVVVDADGCTWLCRREVDESRDLKEQGCWRCEGIVTRPLERVVGWSLRGPWPAGRRR